MSKTGGGVGTNQHQIKGTGKQDPSKPPVASVGDLEAPGFSGDPIFDEMNTDLQTIAKARKFATAGRYADALSLIPSEDRTEVTSFLRHGKIDGRVRHLTRAAEAQRLITALLNGRRN